MNYISLVCMSILLICISCTQKKSSTPSQQAQSNYKIDSPLLLKYFSIEETASLSNILSSFKQGVCKDLSSKESKRCFDLHFQALKSDFFQGIPVYLNFPYGEDDTSLDQFKSEPIVLSVWNDICLMSNEERDFKIEYYCLNSNGPFVDYFRSWSTSNGIYKHILGRIENETLSINQPKELFLVSNEFDFSKIDDRIIYSILHLTLAEEYKALQQ